jgi:signal transduction histidine kinase
MKPVDPVNCQSSAVTAKKPWLVHVHYRMRTVSFLMVFMATSLHIWEKNYSPAAWIFLVLLLLVYPHLQYLRSLRAQDAIKAEIANLLVDSVLLGVFVATVEFSAWLTFSAMMGTLTNNTANKGWRGVGEALLGLLLGALLGGLVGGFRFAPDTTWPATLFCIMGLGGYLLAMNHIAFGRNVQLRAAREQLRQHAERESKARDEQGRFIAMLSHELKTPLSVIDVAAQTLERIDRSHDPEVARRHLRIRRSVSRINRLVEQFLANDRLDAEAMSVQYARVDIAELVREVADTSPDGIERLRLAIPDALWIEADNALLRVAITNLADNALKYSPAETIVSLSATPCEHEQIEGVEVVVVDQGSGISPAFQSRLFSRYTRGDNVGQISGAGLGLHMVQRIAELHGGLVEVTSNASGSVFRMWLPSEASQAPWQGQQILGIVGTQGNQA